MGLFKSAKRAVKKITKPVARVLDKVVPNEIKPALPYLAAIAPYAFGPGVVGASGFQGILANPIARASLAGGLNLGAQLAQEGSEGEFSGISTLLAGLQGFGTAAGADQYLQDLRTPMAGEEGFTGLGAIKSRAIDIGQKGVDVLQGAGEVLRDPFNQGLGDIAKAGAIPFTQGSMDLGIATARKALRDYELELDAFNAQAGANQAASDADRRAAIIASMTRADFTQDIIDETLGQLGLKDGGIARLGFDNGGDVSFGGIKEAIKGVAENNMEEGVTQMYVSDSAGVIPLKAGDAVTGKTMDMMVSGFVEPYTKNDFRDPDGYERFMDVFSEFKETKMKKDEELNEEGMKKGGLASFKDGGIMNLGGKEMDMRTGGFIPIGAKERADDVPARLSKNEFVMTADAVRAAGGGSVNKGAKRMYDLMHNLEARA